MIRLVALGCMVAALGTAAPLHAQEAPAASPSLAPDRKSESHALRLSLFGTAIPVAAGLALSASGPTNTDALPAILLITGGLAIGPSLGHFYAERPGRALATTALRAGVTAASLAIAINACPLEGCTSGEETTFVVSFLAGLAVVSGLTIYDVVSAPASVRWRNERIGLAPWILPGGRVGILARITS